MANLFKQSISRPLPAGAELFMRNGERFARWTVRGKVRTAPVTGDGDSLRVQLESGKWSVRLRMANGTLAEVTTGCKDKSAAASRMTELVQEQEKIRGGIITEQDVSLAKELGANVTATIADYKAHMKALGLSGSHVYNVNMYLTAGVKEMGWKTLRNLSGSGLSAWLDMRAITPKDPQKPATVMGAKTHNEVIGAWRGFADWLAKERRIPSNPFTGLTKRDAHSDRKHVRRMLNDDELFRLFAAAELRPLQDALKGNKGRGEKMRTDEADLTDATKDRLRWLGKVRSMSYRVAVSTGLRLKELRSIRLGDVVLNGDVPHMLLRAGDEKNRKGSIIPVPAALAPMLAAYAKECAQRLAGPCEALPGAFAMERLFPIPAKMCDVIADDYRAAGIDPVDAAGRCVDFHVLRGVFITRLAQAGTPVHVLQKLARHADPKLTMTHYVHTKLADMTDAVNVLPDFQAAKLEAPRPVEEGAENVTPNVTPAAVVSGVTLSFPVINSIDTQCSADDGKECVLSPDGAALQEMPKKEMAYLEGLEPPTSWSVAKRSIQLSYRYA